MIQINQIQERKSVMQTKKFLDTSGFVKKKDNAKITKIENKIPRISGLATTSVLNAAENEISDGSNLVKKTDYDTKK